MDFFYALDCIVNSSQVVIDRPKGSIHPAYPDIEYPLDYGYFLATSAPDGAGIDVFRGSAPGVGITAVYFTIDRRKLDMEAKVVLNCTEAEKREVGRFLESIQLSPLLIERS